MKQSTFSDINYEPLTDKENVAMKEKRIMQDEWMKRELWLQEVKERSKRLEVWIGKGMSIDRQKTYDEKGYWVEDLPHKSRAEVYAICTDCGKYRLLKYQNYRHMCNSCSHSGEKNYNYGITGKNSPRFGKHHSPESIKKMHRSMKSRIAHSCIIRGIPVEEFPGFASTEREFFYNSKELHDWRVSVFERDNYTCQECGVRGSVNLNAHHIVPYHIQPEPEYSLNIDNGITLCKDCHDKTKRHEDEFYNKYTAIVKANCGFKDDFLSSSVILEGLKKQNEPCQPTLFDY